MKELVGKLSRGKIEYDLPETEVTVVSIEKDIETGVIFSDFFEVFDKKGGTIKGIIYSTSEYVKIVNNQFCGKRNRIEYRIDTTVLEPEDEFSGRINVVSNGGESYIPFKFHIRRSSEKRDIPDIAAFAALVKQDYESALKLFLSEDFVKVLLKDNLEQTCIYRGAIENPNKRQAMEEFLIAVNQKQKVEILLEETEKNYKEIKDVYRDSVSIFKNTWGSVDVAVTSEVDFITDFTGSITEQDFEKDVDKYKLTFSYSIDETKLHAGMNYGRIAFQTPHQTLYLNIAVDNRGEYDHRDREIGKCIVDINKIYLDFRMRKCSVDKWTEVSQKLVERARGFKDQDTFLRLFQAQIHISKKEDEKAQVLIDSVTEQVMQQREENIPLYCYYLYLKALHRRELEYTLMITETIRKFYESGYDKWEILWILIYIDPSFENNKSLKIARIKEQFHLGCRSTLMYYEALYALNRQPMLLRMINNFELQVLNFGSKYNAIDLRLAIQLSEVSMHEKKFRPLLFKILVRLYEKFEKKVILNTILSMLIRCNKTEPEYFQWYELGVRMDVPITSLYEYYVMAMPADFSGDIPESVLMYFQYNHSMLGNREAFFYSLLIRDKETYKNPYTNYRKIIENFALDMLKRGRIDKNIAIIYADILTKDLIQSVDTQSSDEQEIGAIVQKPVDEEMLSKVLNTWMIHVLQADSLKEVLVIHKETKKQMVYPIVHSVAYVEIYTDDAVVSFRDINGNIYLNTVTYTMEKLLGSKELNEILLKKNSDNIYIMARECEQAIKYHKELENGAELFRKIMTDDRFGTGYKNDILPDMLDYYQENLHGKGLDAYLRSLDVSKLNRKSRISIAELMITRRLYTEVLAITRKYGVYGMDERKILKLCTYVIRENVPCDKDLLIQYCEMAFRKGKYNENSMSVLLADYNGTTKEMLDLWRVSKEFDTEDKDLEERMIAQMLFSRASIENICSVYDSYKKKGALDMIKHAYLFYNAYVYFVHHREIDTLYFRHLEEELLAGNLVSDICKCSFLLYYSKKQNLKETTKDLCRKLISELENKNIIFDFFKRYQTWFSISGNILDKTTIEYRCKPVDKVTIRYYSENQENHYTDVKMKEVFQGLYTTSINLFYGERICYNIIEENKGEKTITDVMECRLEHRGENFNTSRYGRINELLANGQKDTIGQMALEYYIDDQMVKKLFLNN